MSEHTINTAEVNETEEVVVEEAEVTYENITPYYAAKVANVVLAANGFDKKITPQMFYTYAKKNTIETVEVGGKKYFVGSAFKAYLDKYVARLQNGEQASRVDVESMAAQYM
jgi:hypothetical protein